MKFIIFVILLSLGAFLIDVEFSNLFSRIIADATGMIVILFAGEYHFHSNNINDYS